MGARGGGQTATKKDAEMSAELSQYKYQRASVQEETQTEQVKRGNRGTTRGWMNERGVEKEELQGRFLYHTAEKG